MKPLSLTAVGSLACALALSACSRDFEPVNSPNGPEENFIPASGKFEPRRVPGGEKAPDIDDDKSSPEADYDLVETMDVDELDVESMDVDELDTEEPSGQEDSEVELPSGVQTMRLLDDNGNVVTIER